MVREREWCQTTKTYAESSIKACEQRRHKLNVSWTTSDWPSSSSTTTWPPWAPTKINCCLQMRWAAAIWSRADGNHDVQSNVLRSAIVLSLLTSVLMRLNGIAMNNWYPQWRDNITHCRGFKSQAQWFSTKRLSLSLSLSLLKIMAMVMVFIFHYRPMAHYRLLIGPIVECDTIGREPNDPILLHTQWITSPFNTHTKSKPNAVVTAMNKSITMPHEQTGKNRGD